MGIYGIFLMMGNAGFISSTVRGPVVWAGGFLEQPESYTHCWVAVKELNLSDHHGIYSKQ